MNPNKPYSCLIVDDEPPAREVLRRYVQQVPLLQLAAECSNALQALSFLQQQSVDLLLLDIQLPQVSGMDFIKTLQQKPRIILTTAYEQYAVQAFELEVSDYLLKPIQFERFLKAVIKAFPAAVPIIPINNAAIPPVAPAHPAFLYFRTDRKMVKVILDDILYIESLKDYLKIYTSKGAIVTKHTMTALEAMLPAHAFIRVHRSFMVAVGKIDAFTPEQLTIGQDAIPIGKLYRLGVTMALNG